MVEQSPFSYQNIPGMVYRARPDRSTEIIFNSENVCGFTIEEFGSGKVNWFNIIHPDDRERIVEENSSIGERPRSTMQEYRIVDKGGAVRWVEDYKTSLFSKDGIFKGIDGIVFDVTRSKKTEQASKERERALIESEGSLGSIVENSSDQIFMLDRDFRFISINKTAADLFGMSPQEIVGRSMFEVFPETISAQFSRNIKNVIETGKGMLIEEKMAVKDRELYNSTSLNPVRDDSGRVIAVAGIVRDITERREAEKALQESEERFRTIFEGANDGILIADAKTQRFVLANPQMSQMVGYPLEELLKLGVSDIHPKESLPYVNDQFTKLGTGELGIAKDIPILREDKEIIYCDVSARVLEIWKQQCLVGFFRDVTERKKTEKTLEDYNRSREVLHKELETANQLLGQSNVDLENYTYMVSHDLKAPLRAMRSFSTFLLEDYNGKLDKKGQDYLQRIADASSRMDTLIENLLLLSRVGRKFMEVEVVDLNQLLEEIVEDLKPSIQKSNGKVVFHNLPAVSIPRTWMKELFMNLINNGLKFNKSNTPRVEVTYEEREPELLFKVRDNGIGIEEKYFDRLFTLFERLHTQEEYEGTGAGLAICKKIVQQFGGRIWIESQVSRGSTFFFTLPKKKNPALGGS